MNQGRIHVGHVFRDCTLFSPGFVLGSAVIDGGGPNVDQGSRAETTLSKAYPCNLLFHIRNHLQIALSALDLSVDQTTNVCVCVCVCARIYICTHTQTHVKL